MRISFDNQNEKSPLYVNIDDDNQYTNCSDCLDLFIQGMLALGYHQESIEDAICCKAEEYDLEDVALN